MPPVFTFVLGIILIAVGVPVIATQMASYFRKKLELRARELDYLSEQSAERAARSAANDAALEQRVRVLERIATDRGLDLSDEIDRLRDVRVN